MVWLKPKVPLVAPFLAKTGAVFVLTRGGRWAMKATPSDDMSSEAEQVYSIRHQLRISTSSIGGDRGVASVSLMDSDLSEGNCLRKGSMRSRLNGGGKESSL
jgi:hypothetical protein